MKDNEQLNITHFEMVSIIIAFKLWGHHWKSQKVSLKTNNMARVQIYNNSYTRATYVMNLWLLTTKYDIELVVTHIEGKNNVIADMLSRWNGSDNNHNVLKRYVKNPKWHSVSQQLFEMDYCI